MARDSLFACPVGSTKHPHALLPPQHRFISSQLEEVQQHRGSTRRGGSVEADAAQWDCSQQRATVPSQL